VRDAACPLSTRRGGADRVLAAERDGDGHELEVVRDGSAPGRRGAV